MQHMAITIHEVLDKLRSSATSERDKGARLEKLIREFLRIDPVYAEQFSDVWLWSDWPGREGRPDTGIDLVAVDRLTGGLVAIQCKFFAVNVTINKPDIDSFLSASGKEGFAERIIVSTTAKWNKNAKAAIEGQQIPVRLLGLTDLENSSIDWERFDPDRPAELSLTEKKQLRPHQQRAVDDLAAGLATRERGKLVMACGTGKTFTSLRFAEQHVGKGGSVLFLVPSISLLSQSLREWSYDAAVPLAKLAVCSDRRASSRRGTPDEDISIVDLALPATTSPKVLLERWTAAAKDSTSMTVLFGTYQSIDVVKKAQADGEFGPFDLVVCDEAHRTTGATIAGQDESAFVRVHDNEYLTARTRLYMTATPRIFDDASKAKAGQSAVVLASMDDETMYGPELHRLSFGEAVAKDLLTDYKVVVLAVDETAVASTFQTQLADDGDLKLDDAARIVGCWNGLSKRGDSDGAFDTDPAPMRRAVAFAGTINASKRIEQLFSTVASHYAAKYPAEGSDAQPLRCEVRHVDGTSSALERNESLDWLKDEIPDGDCRILTNARCLSEGVDVPALDAVMFLSPRRSVVDIVQSVGRVMRKAPGKKYGYIILPIGIPAGEAPEQALNNNTRYAAVWDVLQALRAHDERFNAMINRIELSKDRPPGITVVGAPEPAWDQETFDFGYPLDEWRDAIYARLVKKVGTRRYWELWAKDVADIAQRHITRITALLSPDGDPAVQNEFAVFLEGLRGNLNESVTPDEAIEMLAQHLITRPVFDALFADYQFTAHNAVAQSMERMLDVLDEHALDDENETLEQFYESVRMRIDGIDTAEGRQRIVIELYDTFFKTAFKRTVERLGIVYTPVEIVDFILRSTDAILRKHFGKALTDENVHILDGFAGTGTFIVRLLQLGLIDPKDLVRKYREEIHANEILLLAYYIAAVNIESAFHDARSEGDPDVPYEPFPGLILTDTFQSYEEGDRSDLLVLPENNARIARQRSLAITAVVGNPPWSVGQGSANDNNQNTRYPGIDEAIDATYAARSTARRKTSLHDSYIRAIKWASLRLGEHGVIAFVTNGGFLDSNSADGLRKCLAEEFGSLYVFNLRGNGRVAGEAGRREGRPVFEFGGWRTDGSEVRTAEGGSRATVALVVLVKDPGARSPKLVYAQVPDGLSAGEKIIAVRDAGSIDGVDFEEVFPNAAGDWLNQRSDDSERFLPLGDKDGGAAVFATYCRGLMTTRDAWCYNSARSVVDANMRRTIAFCNMLVERFKRTGGGDDFFQEADHSDPGKISWDEKNRRDVRTGRQTAFKEEGLRLTSYRPFNRLVGYLDKDWNNSVYLLPKFFPTPDHQNMGLVVAAPRAVAEPAVLMVDALPDLSFYTYNGQFFPRWSWEPTGSGGATLRMELEPTEPASESVLGSFRRVDNISNVALRAFRDAYGDQVSKDDVFFYCYGLLHSRDYRERYGDDLKKMLPRIPLVVDPVPFMTAGRRLSDMHTEYESVIPFPLEGLPDGGARREALYVKKMRFGQTRLDGRLVDDRSTIIYNSEVTLTGVPENAYDYLLGARSAIEWVMERYQVRTDKASGIVNDPNTWCDEVGDPRYILDLLCRVVTVSLETMKIVDALPPLDIRPDQPKLT
jgi:predicted helicase